MSEAIALKERIDALEKENRERRSELAEVAGAHQRLRLLLIGLGFLFVLVAAFAYRAQLVRAQLSKIGEENAQLRNERKKLRDSVDAFTEANSQLILESSRYAELKAQLDETQKHEELLSEKLKRTKGQSAAQRKLLLEQIEGVNAEVTKLASDVKASEGESVRLQGLAASHERAVESANESLKKMESRLNEVLAQATEKDQQLKLLRDELERMIGQNRELAASNAQTMAKLKLERGAIESVNSALMACRARCPAAPLASPGKVPRR